MSIESYGPGPHLNPFPATGVAVLSRPGAQHPTIETNAVAQARAFVSDYLGRSASDRNGVHAGSVIAIVGEYGTGKTHLGVSILDSIQLASDESIKGFYLDAPADTFVALYRDRFIARLTKGEIRHLVEEYLREVLTERLRRNDLTAHAADALRDPAVSPQVLMSDLGLIESDLMADLRDKLRSVTERDDYGTALALFLRPEFEDAIWEWLRGNPPDPSLQERGIQSSIDSESAVLEAMGVMAFLFGKAGRRFVLLIDEMEKVLTPASGRSIDQATVLAFKKFLEAIGHTRSLLVLIGLPDFLEALPKDAVERFSSIIRPSPLTDVDIATYIKHANQIAGGRSQLKPFSTDTCSYIAEITGGNARKVVRICFLAFQATSGGAAPVTRATIREVAREQFETTTAVDAASEILRVLDGSGWAYVAEEGDGENPLVRKFWMPVGRDEGGITVILSRSVLHDNDVLRLEHSIVQPPPSRDLSLRKILVVNGFLAETHVNRVRAQFDRVLSFSDAEFRENFEAVARGFRQQLENTDTGAQVDRLIERVDQIARQLSYLVDLNERSSSGTPEITPLGIEQAVRRVFADLGAPRVVVGFEDTFELMERAEYVLRSQRPDRDLESRQLHEQVRRQLEAFREKIRTLLTSSLRAPILLDEVSRVCGKQDDLWRKTIRHINIGPDVLSALIDLPRDVFYSIERNATRSVTED